MLIDDAAMAQSPQSKSETVIAADNMDAAYNWDVRWNNHIFRKGAAPAIRLNPTRQRNPPYGFPVSFSGGNVLCDNDGSVRWRRSNEVSIRLLWLSGVKWWLCF